MGLNIIGINATVIEDVDDDGKIFYINRIYEDSCTSIDRVQACYDYVRRSDRVLKDGIFTDEVGSYYSYAFLPNSLDSVYLVTARCSHSRLEKNEAIAYLIRAFDDAIEYVNNLK